MTSGVRFESVDLLEERRQDLRDAREIVLEKVKRKYDKEEKEREAAKIRGEDKWMLPSVDTRIIKESKEISSKKKKIKKEKKKKKKKKKSKESSSDNSDDDDNWVEATNTAAVTTATKQPVIKGPTMPQRESWMEEPLDFLPLTSRQELRDRKKEESEKDDKAESVIEQMGQHARELNPYWKDGGEGLPSEKKQEVKSVTGVGDGGLEWLKKSYLRCKEQAKADGKSFEELATVRWGSVEKIEKLIADAERASQYSSHRTSYRDDRRRGSNRPKFQRPSSPDQRCSDQSRETPRFQRLASPDENRKSERYDRGDRHSDSARERDRGRVRGNDREGDSRSGRDRGRDRVEDRVRNSDRQINRDRDEYKSRRGLRRSSSPSEKSDRHERQGRFQRPSSPDNDTNSHSSPGREIKNNKSNRSRSRSPSDRRQYRHVSPRRSNSRRSRSRSPTDRRKTDGRSRPSEVPRWKKKSTEEVTSKTESDSKDSKTESTPSQSSSRKASSESRKRQTSSSSESSDSSSSSSESESEEEEAPPAPPPVLLTETEMNSLAAKILKAEIMEDENLATELKTKLEMAREAKKNAPNVCQSTKPADDDNEVLLTRTTKSGFVIPLSDARHPKETNKRRKRQKKVATHEDGERMRYFDDDDQMDLKTMVEREKMGTAEDQNSMFARLAGRSVEKTDDDYQVDDMFISKAARQQSESKLEEKDKMKAIMEHQKMSLAISKCQYCFDKIPKHLIIAIGKKSYLCLPQHKPLAPGHCLIVPMMHSAATTAIDEDVWQDMQNFRKTLANMFRERGEDSIFMETSMFLKRNPHTYIECIPLEREVGDLAPIYFKKAIQDSETEWSQNKKVVDLSKKDIRHSVPKGFPYFAVDFGLQGGFAHVIEDEQKFTTYFGREIVGGMMDANHRLWKNPPKENFDEQRIRVLEFSEWWKPHDWTQSIN